MNKENLQQKFINAPGKLLGIGHYFPGDPVTNNTIEKEYGFDSNWIVEHTGVKSRHWAKEGEETFVDLAKKAGEYALKNSGILVTDIDILVCTSSTTRAFFNPSTLSNKYMDIALPLQAELNLSNALCFDIGGAACVGFIDATITAISMLKAMNLKRAMVVCVENPKPVLNFNYKNSTLFGAGAVVTIWEKCARSDSDLLDVSLYTDGTHFNAFDIDDSNKILMKGKEVGEFAPKSLINVTKEILERNNLKIMDIDWFIPHQANVNIINQLKEEMEIPEHKMLINIDKRGNTSCVGGPSCLSEYYHMGKIKKGDLIFTCSFGRGFNWGGILFKA
ncbi:ketoacyl-ACP synthase III [Mediterraneibacter agrestimuris]|uniref:ketoacyl-ACP synthase III n=1 Tax=Mediterraneibacter agrestimuris TaxID=2941333 RepID=UPI00203DB606|nr:ketoacyl-ACP synthase III [Mediterraneibacter agrestimuris]